VTPDGLSGNSAWPVPVLTGRPVPWVGGAGRARGGDIGGVQQHPGRRAVGVAHRPELRVREVLLGGTAVPADPDLVVAAAHRPPGLPGLADDSTGGARYPATRAQDRTPYTALSCGAVTTLSAAYLGCRRLLLWPGAVPAIAGCAGTTGLLTLASWA